MSTQQVADKSTEQTQTSTKRSHHETVISVARVKNGFNKNKEYGINKDIIAKTKKLKAEQEKYNSAKKALETGEEVHVEANGKPVLDAEKKQQMHPLTEVRRKELTKYVEEYSKRYDEIEEELGALGNAQIRFSDEVGLALTVALEEVAKQLLEYSMKRCKIIEEKKMVYVKHLRSGNVEELSYYPLFSKLPTWVNYKPNEEKKGEKSEEKEEKHTEEEKEETKQSPDKTSLFYYICELCKEMIHPVVLDKEGKQQFEVVTRKMKENKGEKQVTVVKRDETGPFKDLRVSSEMKRYVTALMKELCMRLSPLVQLQLQLMKIKTINVKILLSVIKNLMVDCEKYSEKLTYTRVEEADPKAVKEQKKNAEEAKKQNKEYKKKPEKELPRSQVLKIEKQLVFNNKGYEELESVINSKLAAHKKYLEEQNTKGTAGKQTAPTPSPVNV